MNIALLGGSFDPPHLGHFLIARQVLEKVDVDEVWLLPMYDTSAHDTIFQKDLSPVADRLAMAKYLEDNKIKVSDFEIQKNKKSITITTLELLEKEYPQHTFYWITGSDKLATFQKYDRWQDIVEKHKLIVFPREHTLWHIEERVKEGLSVETIPENVIVLNSRDLLLTNISSSAIRERVNKELSITHLVLSKVEEYIKKYTLYT